MKRSHNWIRLCLIGLASFVLLVTVLPEVASGIGLNGLGARLATPVTCGSSGSGSSGSGSSSQCPNGSVSGTVKITGAPSGFTPAYVGAGACPASTPSGVACANPIYSLAGPGGSYTISLSPGKWEVSGFYENSGFGGVFLSAPKFVTVPSGGSVTTNFAVAYLAPATVKGTVTVTGVPAGVPVYQISVLLCPSYAPYTGGFPSIACVSRIPNTALQPASASAKLPARITARSPGSVALRDRTTAWSPSDRASADRRSADSKP